MTANLPKLELSALAEITAKAGKTPRISILAYSGGIMNLAGHGDAVVEVEGIEADDSVTLLADHTNELGAVLGSGTPIKRGGQLYVEGTVSRANESGRNLLAMNADGVRFQASIGAQPTEPARQIKPGETFEANGRTLTAGASGVLLYPAVRLREVTVTPNGADPNTSVTIQAKQTPGVTPVTEATETQDPATILANLKTLDRFAPSLGTEERDGIRASIQTGELDSDGVLEKIAACVEVKAKLAAYEQSGPQPSAVHVRSGTASSSVRPSEVIEAAWHMKNNESEAEKIYDPYTLERARKLQASGNLVEMYRTAAVHAGFTPPQNAAEVIDVDIKASHGGFSSMGNIQTIVGNVANKSAQVQFQENLAQLESIFPPASVSDLKEHTQIRMVDTGEMTRLAQDGEVEANSVSEAVYTLKADTYAAKTTVTRQTMINDDAGVFDTLTNSHVLKALRGVKDTAMRRWLDNAEFFNSDNRNLLTSNALSLDGLSQATTRMETQVDEEGRPIDITPRVLLVAPEKKQYALRLVGSPNVQVIDNTADAQLVEPTGNSFAGLQVLTDPRLSNSNFSGSSATSWYLIGGQSALAPMKLVFLNGKRSPTIDVFGPNHDPKVLGFTIRVYMEWGAGFYEPTSAIKNTA